MRKGQITINSNLPFTFPNDYKIQGEDSPWRPITWTVTQGHPKQPPTKYKYK